MLRSPKEIVTASKVPSANGSWVPSPAVNGSVGRACLPTCSIPIEKSHGTTTAPRSANGHARGAGAGGQVEHPVAVLRVDGLAHLAAPAAVLAQGEHVVGEVVAARDRVEHPTYVGRLLVELRAGHAPRVRVARERQVTRGNQMGAVRVTYVPTTSTTQEEGHEHRPPPRAHRRDRRPALRRRLRHRLGTPALRRADRRGRPAASGSTIEPEETPSAETPRPPTSRTQPRPQDEEPGLTAWAGPARARRRERRGARTCRPG